MAMENPPWMKMYVKIQKLDGGFKDFLFSSLFGEDSHFYETFSIGVETTT